MVTLKEITKSYFNQPPVLRQVSFEMKPGDFIYVIGGTGAGKSTLLSLTATEDAPTSGSISLFGYDLARVSPSTLRAIRQAIGYIPQQVRLIPDLSVFDNVALSLRLAGEKITPDKKNEIHHILEKVSLIHKRNTLCSQISGGEAQRVAFARAVIRRPELIVADEPTGSQDRDHTWILMDIFNRVNANNKTTVIVATHDREIVRRVRKKCLNLRDGMIIPEESQNVCLY